MILFLKIIYLIGCCYFILLKFTKTTFNLILKINCVFGVNSQKVDISVPLFNYRRKCVAPADFSKSFIILKVHFLETLETFLLLEQFLISFHFNPILFSNFQKIFQKSDRVSTSMNLDKLCEFLHINAVTTRLKRLKKNSFNAFFTTFFW